MRFIEIPKRTKGEFRQICVPNAAEKHQFRSHLSALNKKASVLCNPDVVHGFMNSKSPVTNAEKHIGFQFTLKFDLENFFDTVRPEHLRGILTKEEMDVLLPSNRAYQGLPTSPVIANLAAKKMDDAILKMIDKKNVQCIYTRYADDLCFSFNDFSYVSVLKQNIPQIVGRCGFSINKKKTWLQDARYGYRRVTGVSVSSTEIRAPRSVRRRQRAAEHQRNIHEARGLSEWCKMKRPSLNKNKITQGDMNALTKIWKLPRIYLNLIPKKPESITFNYITSAYPEDHECKILISSDPVQILGLSNFTTNWCSCMTHPNGGYHRNAGFWVYLKGTRIAGLLSDRDLTFGPFTRPAFKARALIHTYTNGRTYYDHIYGESSTARDVLRKALEYNGISDICARRFQEQVEGSVSKKIMKSVPYFDNLDIIPSSSEIMVR